MFNASLLPALMPRTRKLQSVPQKLLTRYYCNMGFHTLSSADASTGITACRLTVAVNQLELEGGSFSGFMLRVHWFYLLQHRSASKEGHGISWLERTSQLPSLQPVTGQGFAWYFKYYSYPCTDSIQERAGREGISF